MPICYLIGIFYSLTEIAQQREIYFMAFIFVGCLSGFVTETINLAKNSK